MLPGGGILCGEVIGNHYLCVLDQGGDGWSARRAGENCSRLTRPSRRATAKQGDAESAWIGRAGIEVFSFDNLIFPGPYVSISICSLWGGPLVRGWPFGRPVGSHCRAGAGGPARTRGSAPLWIRGVWQSSEADAVWRGRWVEAGLVSSSSATSIAVLSMSAARVQLVTVLRDLPAVTQPIRYATPHRTNCS